VSSVANTQQYAEWNGDSGRRWVATAERRDHVLAPVGDAVLAAARLSPGERVLDIGCGCGATTLAAARAVGPSGSALGADLSEPMLAVARGRAAAEGIANASFVQADAQVHRFDPDHDVAISRFGTMFFDDPAAAFANIVSALRPGGRLAIATWQPLLVNDWLTVPGAALLTYGSMPTAATAAGPGMFAQSDPDAVRATLEGAGLADVHVEPVALTLTLGADLDEAVDYLADSGPGRAILETVADEDRSAALDAVRAALADRVTPQGVQLGAAILVTTAQR
jgi:SAM-dependent methyltransferase